MSTSTFPPKKQELRRRGRPRSTAEPRSRTTITVQPSLFSLIRGTENVSGRLDNAARRLMLLTDELHPELTPDEWAFVVLALREGPAETEVDVSLMGFAHLYGEQARDAYGIDVFELLGRIEQFSLAMKVVMCELVERYWQFDRIGKLDHAERLRLLRLASAEEAELWKAEKPKRTAAIRRAASPDH